MKRTVIAQQGEAKVYRIDAIPAGITAKGVERTASGAAIISHSESGHHHVIDCGAVMERTDGVPSGMRVLYAIVTAPTSLRQDAAVPHDPVMLDPGIYEFRVQREFDPFLEQARRVAD